MQYGGASIGSEVDITVKQVTPIHSRSNPLSLFFFFFFPLKSKHYFRLSKLLLEEINSIQFKRLSEHTEALIYREKNTKLISEI